MKINFRLVLFSLILGLGLGFALGCKPASAPLPAGAINAVDAQTNADLQAAHAYVAQWQADVKAGKYTPSAQEKSIFSSLVTGLNTADPLYQSWHTALATSPTTGEPAELSAAITAIEQNLAQLITLAKGA
jgi:hypothetical protein